MIEALIGTAIVIGGYLLFAYLLCKLAEVFMQEMK